MKSVKVNNKNNNSNITCVNISKYTLDTTRMNKRSNKEKTTSNLVKASSSSSPPPHLNETCDLEKADFSPLLALTPSPTHAK